jgi:hypothetical protein
MIVSPPNGTLKWSAALCLAVFVAAAAWVALEAERFAPIADFKVFYSAGRIVADGRGSELYSKELQAATIAEVASGHTKFFFNPPAFALLFVPLASLPLMSAYALWCGFSLGLLLAGLRMLTRLARLDLAASGLFIAAFLAFEPTYHNLRWGNISALLLLVAGLFFRDLLADRERRAGIWLALLMMKPELFLLPLLVLAAKRRWRVVGPCLAGGAVLLLISLAVVGPDGFERYVALNLEAARSYTPAQSELNLRGMPSWRGLFVRLLGGGATAETLALVFVAGSFVVLALAWRGPWRSNELRFGCQWALTLLVSLLAAPHVYLQSLILLAPAAAVVLRGAPEAGSPLPSEKFARIALLAVAMSWLPEVDAVHGLTALQAGLISTTAALGYSLLAARAAREPGATTGSKEV